MRERLQTTNSNAMTTKKPAGADKKRRSGKSLVCQEEGAVYRPHKNRILTRWYIRHVRLSCSRQLK